MAGIAQLKAMVGLNTRRYEAGARRIQGRNRMLMRSFRRIGRAIGISFSIAAVVRFGRSIQRMAEDTSVAARNVGIMTDEMIALNRVAIQSSLGTNELQRMLSRLQTELFRAAQEGGEAAEKFSDLGLSASELNQMDPASALQEVARAAMASGVPLTRLSEIFGERLGPRAMVALRQISEEGLPRVDENVGYLADRVEDLSSRWTVAVDRMREGTVLWIDETIFGIQAMATGISALFRGEGFRGADDAMIRLALQREARIAEARTQRQREERSRQEEMGRLEIENQRTRIEELKEAKQEQMQQAVDGVRAMRSQFSQMEQMGAAFGGERSGLQRLDRQIQISQQQLNVQQEFRDQIAEVRANLEAAQRNQ